MDVTIDRGKWTLTCEVRELYTVNEAAILLQVSTAALYARVKRGTLRAETMEVDGKDVMVIPHNELVNEALRGKRLDPKAAAVARTLKEMPTTEQVVPSRDRRRLTPSDFLK
jgi:hypothetical protein